MNRADKKVVIAALANYRKRYKGKVPSRVVREMAEANGLSERTLWRWLKDAAETVDRGQPFELTNDHLVKVRSHLNLKAAYDDLFPDRDVLGWVSYSTFHRAWLQLPAAIRDGVLRGWDEMAKNHVYVSMAAPHRNHTWHLDHTQADIWVYTPRHGILRPWVSMIRDNATSMILAATVYIGRPNEDSCADILATAVCPKEYRIENGLVRVGGLPVQVTYDNAREHFAEAITKGLMILGVVQNSTKAYYKHLNAPAETSFNHLCDGLLKGLPGYRHGGKDDEGKDLIVSHYPDQVDPATVLTLEQFQRHLDQWVVRKNRSVPVRRLGGRTPLEAWATDPTEVAWVPDQTIRALMMRASTDRAINKEGIRFNGIDYIAPELNAYREKGKKVTVRYLHREPRFIEVFDGDEWVCRAYDRNLLDDAQKRLILQYRKADLELLKQISADANRDRIHRAMTTAEQEYDGTPLDGEHLQAINAALSNVVDLSRHRTSNDGTDDRGEDVDDVVDPTAPALVREDPTNPPPPRKRQRATPKKTAAQDERSRKARERIQRRPGSDFGGIS